jgi:hypothetical protein
LEVPFTIASAHWSLLKELADQKEAALFVPLDGVAELLEIRKGLPLIAPDSAVQFGPKLLALARVNVSLEICAWAAAQLQSRTIPKRKNLTAPLSSSK